MTDYRAVMKLLVQQRSYRQIEQQLGCSHRAISRSNQVLRSLGIRTVDQVLALTDDELDELFVDGRGCPILCVRGLGLQVVRESVGVSHG